MRPCRFAAKAELRFEALPAASLLRAEGKEEPSLLAMAEAIPRAHRALYPRSRSHLSTEPVQLDVQS